ncbi:MAG: hypothetical protein IID13_01170 [Candidatus Marinimicrobia bacterium]|nr:hypothetical protein [Candidatus Neomarinimicrobiota bacterium]
MSSKKVAHGRDLFIIDNSISGWTGRRYLEEWAETRSQMIPLLDRDQQEAY